MPDTRKSSTYKAFPSVTGGFLTSYPIYELHIDSAFVAVFVKSVTLT